MTSPAQKNIREIVSLERDSLGQPSFLDRVTDVVSSLASGPSFVIIHLLWFTAWMALNSRSGAAFDPFPFTLLTLIVSLEAIVLTGFVLRAQSRMTMQADRRAQLGLQINLLAEQELTAILRVLCAIGEKDGIDVASCDPCVAQFRAQTDVRAIAAQLENERAAANSPDKRTTGVGAQEWPPPQLNSPTR